MEIIFLLAGGVLCRDALEQVACKNKTSLKTTVLSHLIQQLHYNDVSFHLVCLENVVTSQEADRELIYDKLRELEIIQSPIVVIHTTDTLPTLYNYIYKKHTFSVPVIFTGALHPAEISGSDAMQNVTESIMAARFLESGLYLCFHGKIFADPHFKKDNEEGTFVEIRVGEEKMF